MRHLKGKSLKFKHKFFIQSYLRNQTYCCESDCTNVFLRPPAFYPYQTRCIYDLDWINKSLACFEISVKYHSSESAMKPYQIILDIIYSVCWSLFYICIWLMYFHYSIHIFHKTNAEKQYFGGQTKNSHVFADLPSWEWRCWCTVLDGDLSTWLIIDEATFKTLVELWSLLLYDGWVE